MYIISISFHQFDIVQFGIRKIRSTMSPNCGKLETEDVETGYTLRFCLIMKVHQKEVLVEYGFSFTSKYSCVAC
jgi:hypothetical protein